MKNYKWLIILMFLGCKHNYEPMDTNKNVLAGVVSENMVYHDFEPDIIIDTITVSKPFSSEVNFLNIDINHDGSNDLKLRSLSNRDDFNYALSTDLTPLKTHTNQISINGALIVYDFDGPLKQSYRCNGLVKKMKYKEAIGFYSGIWTTFDSLYNGYPLTVRTFGLAFKNIVNEDVYETYGINNWRNTNNSYMGIRFLQGNDTLYGWVRMSVVGYTKIVLHDCAIQKK
jgi:hypothetical protein